MNENGLYNKYTIIKNSDVSVVKDKCFILKPQNDPHARAALEAYAKSVEAENPELANDIRNWLQEIKK